MPASTQITTAATPAAKTQFEVILARQSPNVQDITSNATMNALNTWMAHAKSLGPDVSEPFPGRAIEYASAAPSAVTAAAEAPTFGR